MHELHPVLYASIPGPAFSPLLLLDFLQHKEMEVCHTRSHFNTKETGCVSLANPSEGTRSIGTLCTNNHLYTSFGGQDICLATIFENFYLCPENNIQTPLNVTSALCTQN